MFSRTGSTNASSQNSYIISQKGRQWLIYTPKAAPKAQQLGRQFTVAVERVKLQSL